MNNKIIKYIYSEKLCIESDKNPAILNRSTIVHELIKSFNLLHRMELVKPKYCKHKDLRELHTSDYLDFLKRRSQSSSSDSENDHFDEDVTETFGLDYDCPTWPGMWNYICLVSGSTVTACEEISKDNTDIVINWFGGWHHAHRDKAAGFCYINDIVLGIIRLWDKYERVLYIDLDVHHGDGVEEAFETSRRVFTLSFHQFEVGFYPGTGDTINCGFGNARGYSANLPYKSGIKGEAFIIIFQRIFQQIFQKFAPNVCVVQCGGDVIAGDPLGGTNLTPEDMTECVRLILSKPVPTVILGGGGYNLCNTSRYWTSLTAMICDMDINEDIPEENEFFLQYGPDYTMNVPRKKHLPDNNTTEYLEKCCRQIEENLEKFNVNVV